MGKSSIGLGENVAGLLCYVLGWVSGLILLLLERESRFVRFHAIQSIFVFGVLTVASIVIGWIPVIGAVVSYLVSLLALALWIVLMIKAYQGQLFKLPWSGDFAEKRMG